MMALAQRRIEPDFVVAALFNVCCDYEMSESLFGRDSTQPDDVNPAQKQLGEYDQPAPEISGIQNFRYPVPSWQQRTEEEPQSQAIQVLLGLADAIWHKDCL